MRQRESGRLVMLKKGDWVWVDSVTGVPIGARIKVTPSGQRLLVDDEGNERSLSQAQEASLQVMHPTSVEGVDDMIKLGDMTEAGLLRNLQLRHKQGIIYTYIGSVLVAVNPYQDFPIYSAEQVRLYHGQKLGELPPHIFAIAESCYFNMTRHLRNQCCIISGETGAGKTESTKLILQYLAAVSGERSKQTMEQQILESNPILEAFGNAKTIHNDNSSRFGKYLEIFFTKEGLIKGARVEQYLLEKSRVCHQALGERNYHIFYCMLAGISAEQRKSLSLKDAKAYKFLTKGDCVACESKDDAKDYRHIHSALKILTFSESLCHDIFKLLAAILHLGNVCFEATTENNLETSDVSKSKHFTVAASLLEVQTSSLATSLTNRSFQTNRESVTKPLSSEQAADCRDAFVKAIYNKLFIWIVDKINSVTYQRLINTVKSSYQSIGLLDIFGFENFSTNSFEQLCINFANEKLQQFFVGHIFKLEQEEYLKEDIVWNNIDFSDNQNILDLMAEKTCNVLALIDEESHFPKGSDATMLSKMNGQHSGNKSYICSKREHDTIFGIQHFAGVVYYDSKGFLEKNRDVVSYDLIKTVKFSTNKLLHQIFEAELSTSEVKMSNNKKVILTPKSSLRAKMDKRKQAPTLIGQFRQSLDSLMKALSACQPAFIRCFKPNSDKESQVFDRRLCWLQLRYSGMMSTIRIRKLGFPILHTFEEFLKRYWVLLRTTRCDPKTETAAACCEAICNTVIEKKGDWKIGRTKVFLKDAHDVVLERLREEELNGIVVVIQRFMRVHKDRKSFLRKRRAAVVLQRHWRANRGDDKRKKFLYQQQCAAALTIQTQVRGYLVRKRLKQKREAVILLQAHTRGFLARRAVGKMSNDYESWENIALSLQRGLEDLIESQLENEERELDTEHFLPAPALEVVQEEASDSDKSERRDTPEPAVPDLDPSTSSSEDDSAEFDDENDEFSFSKFSLQHFQGNTNHKHITQRLKQPLLRHDDEGDALACLTVWWIILRFMEDIPEPISQTFTSMLSQKQSRGLSTLVGLEQKKMKKAKKKLRGGIRGASVLPDEPENGTEDGHILIGEGPTLDRPLSPLEKVHIIVGYALSRQDIRDEIYCQICKQLVNNNNRKSRMLGWTLLSICLGIFPPTERFIKYLKSFVSRGPSGYGAYCTERLRRTVANGGRKELPCWIELQAAKSKEPIDVSVSLMDDRTVTLHLDSASTSAEVCQAVADKTDLTDTYGFSLYISFCDQMWSLGSCGKHVLDAVSHCEQETKQRGQQEKDANWSLSIRKELFTPWHDCSVDMISTDLIYRQVIKGIKSEEYVSEKEDDYIQLAVKHYYIQFGSAHSEENVQKVVEGCITTTLIENKSMAKWIQLIGSALLQGPYATGIQSRNHVKGEFVDCAREKWPLKFSMFYEVIMMSGPHFPKRRFTVAVNWVGIVFMDGRKTLLDFPYHEVKEFQRISEGHTDGQSVSLATVHGDFVLKCEQAVEMGTLIENTLEGLRHRSVYALAKQDFSRPDDPVFLVCRRGDLLLVEKDKGYSTEEDWIRATNQTTPGTGVVLKEVVQFLPILTRPTDKMLELLSPSWKKQLPAQSVQQRDESVVPVSLKDFALENFRPAGKDGRQGAVKGLNREKLWVYSRDPLKRPLLKSLLNNSELNILACNASTAILKYMGDYPIKLARSPVDLTDQIFGAATQHEALQDEIYCQIMRQMTGNNNRLSVERGWELMWLCSGLFPPSPILIKHAQCFLESRPRAPLAAVCLQRVQEMRRKEPRKLPPHLVEVDAIQKNSTQIFHKIHFPNDTNEIYEVTSTTSNKDLCSSIASQLRLSSDDGYSLFLKTPNKITSLEEQKYFFDSLKQTSDLPKKVKKAKEGNPANMPFLVIFKRKLWFNVIPGKDLVADLTFHFPQELSKYLQGYHSCTKEDMITLAGLLFRCKVDSDRSQFVMIPRMLKELIPADQFKIMSTEEWKKHIISSYNKQSGITVQEAKIAFLKAISSWTTFGCAFFQVKQTCESSYPNTVLIAISKQGVSLIDPDNKTLLVMHPFTRITAYHSKDSSFVMTTGTAVRGNIFVCETSQAHTMEDLLRSYVSMYERQRQAFRPRLNLMFT